MLLFLNRWEEAPLKRLNFHLTKDAVLLECGWSTSVVCLLHSPSGFFGVALCWNKKIYWCLKEVSATSFLVIGKTSVNITILIWCWPRIHNCLLYYTSMQIHLTSDCGWPASSFNSIYYIWTMMCLHTNLKVSVYILYCWI